MRTIPNKAYCLVLKLRAVRDVSVHNLRNRISYRSKEAWLKKPDLPTYWPDKCDIRARVCKEKGLHSVHHRLKKKNHNSDEELFYEYKKAYTTVQKL